MNSHIVIFDVQKSVKCELLITNRLKEHDEEKATALP